MKIARQKDGMVLTDAENKELTALLVKLGYTVTIRREKVGNGAVSATVIEAKENE